MPPTQKAVLISLADNANDHGECWPSIPTICRRTCLGKTAVISALKWLEERSALSVHRGVSKSNQYLITPTTFQGDVSGDCHYVYRITHRSTGVFYIGLRSCYGSPVKDDYWGSGRACEWLSSVRDECTREIVGMFPTREEAANHESRLIAESIDLAGCLNRRSSSPQQALGNAPSSLLDSPSDEPSASRTVRQTNHQQSASRTEPVRQANPNRKEPSRTVRNTRGGKKTFDQWTESLGDDDAIPADDSIFEWSRKAGIPDDFLELAWLAFADRFTGNGKLYTDWRATFRNYVKNGWLNVWRVTPAGAYVLTDAGQQWAHVRQAEQRDAA